MPVCARPEPFDTFRRRPVRRLLVRLVIAGLCGAWFGLAQAGNFKVIAVQASANESVLRLEGAIDLTITPPVEEAISNGIPIDVVIDIRLYRERALLWDAQIASWALRRELRYHALTGQYLLSAGVGAPVARETFASLNQALNEMGSLTDLSLRLRDPLAEDAHYYVKVRASLDVEALPSLLRPVAYTSRAWNLNSGWTTWTVQP